MIARRLANLLSRNWMIAWVVAAMAPLVYYGVRLELSELGYQMFPMFVNLPDTLDLLWIVAPGAALASVLLDWTLGPFRPGTYLKRVGAGLVLGGVLGWANVPLSVLLALYLDAAAPGSSRSFAQLLPVWLQSIPAMLALGFPVAVPCGVALGFVVASMGALEVRPEE